MNISKKAMEHTENSEEKYGKGILSQHASQNWQNRKYRPETSLSSDEQNSEFDEDYETSGSHDILRLQKPFDKYSQTET